MTMTAQKLNSTLLLLLLLLLLLVVRRRRDGDFGNAVAVGDF